MKELCDFKLTILPMVVLLLLTILWKLTESVGAGIILILFWMSWRQFIRKII
ncbi:hypothetical protein [Lysinibacillus sphaericus]|uniref:hypothetical protein n=1 Tax=Lysinibacillus sphaericus TaxID=1421 RepID=UPI0015D4D616|nr:hypothetical protein [Lysinibacillus sphaericus]